MATFTLPSIFLITAIIASSTLADPIPSYKGGHSYIGSYFKRSISIDDYSSRMDKSDYFLSTDAASWVDGRDYCVDHGIGKLVAIESEEENDVLGGLLRDKDVVEAWTSGGYYTDNIFRWYSTNTNFGYVSWDSDEPTNGDPDWRVVVRSRGFFAPWGVARATAADLKRFICERNI